VLKDQKPGYAQKAQRQRKQPEHQLSLTAFRWDQDRN